MSDVKIAYNQVMDFMSNETEKTMLLRGIADKEKNRILLKALDDQGNLEGMIILIHTTKSGMESFFRHAELYKVPKKYGQAMKYSNLTIYFDNLSTKNYETYDNYVFDFMIVWPIQSVTINEEEIQLLKYIAETQKTKKIIFLTVNESKYDLDSFETFVNRVIKLDIESDGLH